MTVIISGSDASLLLLSLLPAGSLSPAFDPAVFEYSLRVPHEQDSVYFVAVTRDAPASVKGDRQHKLEVGDSVFSIIVTAENGKNGKDLQCNGDQGSCNGGGIRFSGGVLYVDTPEAERITVYTTGGKLLSGVSISRVFADC